MTIPDLQVLHNDLNEETLHTYLQSPFLAVDCETMGLVPRRDRLCVVQLCDVNQKISFVRFDRLVQEAPLLKQLMEADHVLKLFHYARFDVGMLKYHLDINTQPIFCTKIASKLARTYSPRHGLKEVVRDLEKIELDKTEQSSDWGSLEELSTDQIAYAANDVRYLIGVYQKLLIILQREDRYQIALSCNNFLTNLVTMDLLGYEDVFAH